MYFLFINIIFVSIIAHFPNKQMLSQIKIIFLYKSEGVLGRSFLTIWSPRLAFKHLSLTAVLDGFEFCSWQPMEFTGDDLS